LGHANIAGFFVGCELRVVGEGAQSGGDGVSVGGDGGRSDLLEDLEEAGIQLFQGRLAGKGIVLLVGDVVRGPLAVRARAGGAL